MSSHFETIVQIDDKIKDIPQIDLHDFKDEGGVKKDDVLKYANGLILPIAVKMGRDSILILKPGLLLIAAFGDILLVRLSSEEEEFLPKQQMMLCCWISIFKGTISLVKNSHDTELQKIYEEYLSDLEGLIYFTRFTEWNKYHKNLIPKFEKFFIESYTNQAAGNPRECKPLWSVDRVVNLVKCSSINKVEMNPDHVPSQFTITFIVSELSSLISNCLWALVKHDGVKVEKEDNFWKIQVEYRIK